MNCWLSVFSCLVLQFTALIKSYFLLPYTTWRPSSHKAADPCLVTLLRSFTLIGAHRGWGRPHFYHYISCFRGNFVMMIWFLGTKKINLLWWSGYKAQVTTGKGFVIKQCATVLCKEPKQPQNSRLDSCVIFTLFGPKGQLTEMRSSSASVCSDQGETP